MLDGFYENKRVLVTGHTGFKGTWLVEWLLKLGAQVTGYSLPPEKSRTLFNLLSLESQLEHLIGDICDQDALTSALGKTEPEIVFHLAAQPLVLKGYEDPVGTISTNVMGTTHLLDAVRQTESVKVVIVVSTDKCYENNEWEWGYREQDTLGGQDPYSASKAAMEILFRAMWCSSLKKAGVAAATARSGNVIGGGDWAESRIIPDCMRALRQGEKIIIRHPKATRPWQHVLEPLGGYLLLAKKLWENEVGTLPLAWNFGPVADASRRVERVVQDVIRHWGSGAYVAEPSANAPHEAGQLRLNTDRAAHLLQWRPHWNYEESIRRTVDWYRMDTDGGNLVQCTKKQIDDYQVGWKKTDG